MTLYAKPIKPNTHFIGRQYEIDKLHQVQSLHEASILVVYGRRRIGKTELLEQFFRTRRIIKLEGIEGKPPKKQIESVLWQLSQYARDPYISKLKLKTWKEVFQFISKFIAKGKWTLYLEELQWLASYGNELITDLKYVWDNSLRYNKNLILVLCGSSPSFMLNHVLKSRALYNRSEHEIHLQEFDFPETKKFLGKKRSAREIMDAYLTVGGVPEYLKYVNRDSSVHLGLCRNSFTSGGFFSREYERIFTSSLAKNIHYKKIISFLSKKKFATRTDILRHLKIRSGGGRLCLAQRS